MHGKLTISFTSYGHLFMTQLLTAPYVIAPRRAHSWLSYNKSIEETESERFNIRDVDMTPQLARARAAGAKLAPYQQELRCTAKHNHTILALRKDLADLLQALCSLWIIATWWLPFS